MNCTQCGKRIDLSRAHRPGDGADWSSTHVAAHARDFCSMECADVWEADPKNAEAVVVSHRKANCSAYVDCLATVVFGNPTRVGPRFVSCDADCPLRTVVVRSRS